MKLYYVVGSPNCRKVHAVVSRTGLKVDMEYMDFFTGELQAPAYHAVNPNGMVPALVDGDLKLWESNAIMAYLADAAGADALYPRDAKRRADVQRWLFWEVTHFNKALGILSFETVAKPNFMNLPPNEPLVAIAKGRPRPVCGRSRRASGGPCVRVRRQSHDRRLRDDPS
jgi:glutathione S-transferase